MSTTPEGKIKALVKTRLKALGAYFFMPVQTGFGATSLDFIGCYKGFYFAVETKRDAHALLTPRQQGCKAQMEEAGAMVFVVYDAVSAEHMIVELLFKGKFDLNE